MYTYAALDYASLRQARLRTNVMTGAILAGMVFILYLCTSFVFGDDAVLVAWAVVLFIALLSARPSAPLVMRFARAVPISPHEAPDLYAAVRELSRRAGLTTCPTLWWIGTPNINAFAAGHGDGAGIALSNGSFRALSRQELISVLAHEVAHIAAGDTRLLTVGAVLFKVTQGVSALGMVASLAVLVLAGDAEAVPVELTVMLGLSAPVVALLYLGLSRNREFAADLTAARLTGDAIGLARALERLELYQCDHGSRHPLLRTHPPTAERVSRLLGNVTVVSPRSVIRYC